MGLVVRLAVNVSTPPRTGPMHGVHPSAKAPPNRRRAKDARRLCNPVEPRSELTFGPRQPQPADEAQSREHDGDASDPRETDAMRREQASCLRGGESQCNEDAGEPDGERDRSRQEFPATISLTDIVERRTRQEREIDRDERQDAR